MTDIGGNLLGKIEKDSIPWLPLYRTHSLTEHPLWFGIYNHLIYHHGAGFREPVSRLDESKQPLWFQWLQLSIDKSRSLLVILQRIKERILTKRVGKNQVPVHDKIHEGILSNNEFFKKEVFDNKVT